MSLPLKLAPGPLRLAHDGFHPGAPLHRACGRALAEHIAGAVWPRL